MKLRIDRESDALYFRLDDSEIVESEEVQPGVILDFNEHGQVVGLEMLHISERVDARTLQSLEFDTAQVFDALSFYSDHQEAINQYIEHNQVPDSLTNPLVRGS